MSVVWAELMEASNTTNFNQSGNSSSMSSIRILAYDFKIGYLTLKGDKQNIKQP